MAECSSVSAYSVAINAIYANGLPTPVARTRPLCAHPEPGRPPTVITTAGAELDYCQQRWLDLLARWYVANGHEVQAEQVAYIIGLKQST